MNTSRPSDIVAQLGACAPLELKHTGRMIVCTMRTLNEALILKPALLGLGVDLNVVVEHCLRAIENATE